MTEAPDGSQADRVGWDPAAVPSAHVRLRFPGAAEKALDNFSAATRVGDTLFVADDEHAAFRRLARRRDEWIEDGSFELSELLPVDEPGEEPDIEGLAAADAWLWIVGSHCRTRPKPEKAPDERIDLDKLARLKDTRARCLLARVPLVEADGRWTPVKTAAGRGAGMVRQTRRGSALLEALRDDPLLAPFTAVPSKEGGVDVEGIAVAGQRVALGMRGPVIASHALLLEFTVAAKRTGDLEIAAPPIKRLLALEGLGIRDLKRLGDDLLILAGPTTNLSGPCALYRWRGWIRDLPQDPHKVRLHRPERILELPFGRGHDHPEGLALWPDAPGEEPAILVIYDSPAPRRVDLGGGTVVMDVFRLPKRG